MYYFERSCKVIFSFNDKFTYKFLSRLNILEYIDYASNAFVFQTKIEYSSLCRYFKLNISGINFGKQTLILTI